MIEEIKIKSLAISMAVLRAVHRGIKSVNRFSYSHCTIAIHYPIGGILLWLSTMIYEAHTYCFNSAMKLMGNPIRGFNNGN